MQEEDKWNADNFDGLFEERTVVGAVVEGCWYGVKHSGVDGGVLSCGYLLWKGCSKRGEDEGDEKALCFCLTLELEYGRRDSECWCHSHARFSVLYLTCPLFFCW